MAEKKLPDVYPDGSSDPKQVSRRKFLNYAGLSAVTAVALASCKKDFRGGEPNAPFAQDDPHNMPKNTVNLGSGDIGILNYAYALEQLEAAFYIKVASSFYSGATSKEKAYLEDIRDHEIAHREFFKTALGNKAIGPLLFDFSSIDFSSRASVLGTAKAFEDLGVSAYNGAGELLQSPDYLLLAGKIVSVEARHAAAIRDLLSYGSFAGPDVVDSNGLDVYRKPMDVLSIANNYIETKIIANNLPTA
ncbi:ferritin-like domain-containing protein [Flavisolibacter nicotianae]|uniref:ferritin-like domain-containing protein n=1 Tax=Flavisolibacter nicotianae TaxID=2364882 RepID=UPI000EB59376|nr:ferritin-like domain-containing protein [Flavisolibacter nicotianae]